MRLSGPGKNVLLAWEYGGGLGHLNHLSWVAKHLVARGFNVYLAVQDLSKAKYFLYGAPVHLLQAPRFDAAPIDSHITYSFSDVLFSLGLSEVKRVKALIENWLQLIRLINPCFIVEDYCVSLRMAAHALKLPSLSIGSGFGIPDPRNFNFDYLTAKTDSNLSTSKADAILNSMNIVYDQLGFGPCDALSSIYITTSPLICCYPEIETYGPRQDQEDYIGPIFPGGQQGKNVDFALKDVFVYLKGSSPSTSKFLDALSQLELSSYIYTPGLKNHEYEYFSSKGLHINKSPFDIRSILSACRVVVCHASTQLVCQSLSFGRPLYVFPTQLEQQVLSKKLEQLKLGKVGQPEWTAVAEDLDKLIHDLAFKSAAGAFQVQAAKFTEAFQVQCLMERVEHLLR